MSNYSEKFEKMRIAGKLASKTLELNLNIQKIQDLIFYVIKKYQRLKTRH